MKVSKLLLCGLVALNFSSNAFAREFILKRYGSDTFITQIYRNSANSPISEFKDSVSFSSNDISSDNKQNNEINNSDYLGINQINSKTDDDKKELIIEQNSFSRMSYIYNYLTAGLKSGHSLEEAVDKVSEFDTNVIRHNDVINQFFGYFLVKYKNDSSKEVIRCSYGSPIIRFGQYYEKQKDSSYDHKNDFSENYYASTTHTYNGVIDSFQAQPIDLSTKSKDFIISKYTSKTKRLVEKVLTNMNINYVKKCDLDNCKRNNSFIVITEKGYLRLLNASFNQKKVYFAPLIYFNDARIKRQYIFSINGPHLDIIARNYFNKDSRSKFTVIRKKFFFKPSDYDIAKEQNPFTGVESTLFSRE